MSQIIHRCLECGKPDYWRDGTIAAGRTVIAPAGPPGAAGVKTCNCDDCVAFYAQVTA
jgi:hypothetical protein